MIEIPPTLEYATVEDVERPSPYLYRLTRNIAIVPQTVGILIVLAFAVTRLPILMSFGLFWLAAGGLLTLLALVLTTIYLGSIKTYDAKLKQRKQQGLFLLVLSMSNILEFIDCLLAGIGMANNFLSPSEL